MLDNQLAEHNLETEILNKYTQELITKISFKIRSLSFGDTLLGH